MPKVTLIEKGYVDYHLVYGRELYKFRGGRQTQVPREVAQVVRTKKDRRGNPLFLVEESPEAADPAFTPALDPLNLDVCEPYQMRFARWD